MGVRTDVSFQIRAADTDCEQHSISWSRLTLGATKMCVCVSQAGYGSGEERNRSDENMGIRSTSTSLRATGKQITVLTVISRQTK